MQSKKTKLQNQNLPEGWRKVKLGEVAGVLAGFAFKSEWFNTRKIGFPVIKIQNITGGLVDVASIEYIDTAKVKRDFSKFRLRKGDFLVAMTGATAGKVGLLTQEIPCYLNQRVGKFYSKNENELDKKFLYYSVINPKNLYLLKKLADGSAQGNMSSSQIEDTLEIFFPEDLNEQRHIASILSAFDDKIELNNKINKTLEEMAQAIFKHWFVDFKFPGYEKTKFVNSELGKIPEGWKVGYLGDGKCSEIIKPGIEKFDGEKIYLATADVAGNEIINYETKITFNRRPIRANSQLILNSIWFAKMIKTYKVLFFFEGNKEDINKYILSTGFVGIKALRDLQYFLYLFINSAKFHKIKDTLVQGAVQEALTNTTIKAIKIIIPPNDIIFQFNKKVEPLIVEIYKNKKENQKLTELRDLLLPKLMSGEIRV